MKASERVQKCIEQIAAAHVVWMGSEVIYKLEDLKLEFIKEEESAIAEDGNFKIDSERLQPFLDDVKERASQVIKDYDFERNVDLSLNGNEIMVNIDVDDCADEVESAIQDIAEDVFPEYFGLKKA